jgi:hypothetical protein
MVDVTPLQKYEHYYSFMPQQAVHPASHEVESRKQIYLVFVRNDGKGNEKTMSVEALISAGLPAFEIVHPRRN